MIKKKNKKQKQSHKQTKHTHSIHCKLSHPTHEIKETVRRKEIPRCKTCGHLVKTDVILFGEKLPKGIMEEALEESKKCDVMIVIGSSLQGIIIVCNKKKKKKKKTNNFFFSNNHSSTRKFITYSCKIKQCKDHFH